MSEAPIRAKSSGRCRAKRLRGVKRAPSGPPPLPACCGYLLRAQVHFILLAALVDCRTDRADQQPERLGPSAICTPMSAAFGRSTRTRLRACAVHRGVHVHDAGKLAWRRHKRLLYASSLARSGPLMMNWMSAFWLPPPPMFAIGWTDVGGSPSGEAARPADRFHHGELMRFDRRAASGDVDVAEVAGLWPDPRDLHQRVRDLGQTRPKWRSRHGCDDRSTRRLDGPRAPQVISNSDWSSLLRKFLSTS